MNRYFKKNLCLKILLSLIIAVFSDTTIVAGINSPSGISRFLIEEDHQKLLAATPCMEKGFPRKWIERIAGLPVPYKPVSFSSEDINNDGFKDLVLGAWWYKNPGYSGEDWERHLIGAPLNNVAILHDFDNDGDIDVFGSQGQHTGVDLAWAENDGIGNFTIHTNIPAGTSTWNESFIGGAALGNFNNVPNTQIAITWNGADSSGSYVQMITVPLDPVNDNWSIISISPDSHGQEISAGDIDNDGDLDLFQGANWLRNENGSWTTFSTGIDIPSHSAQNILADLDNNGQLEGIVLQGEINKGLFWFKPNPDPHQPWEKNTITGVFGLLDMVLVDLDEDGDLDIVGGSAEPFQSQEVPQSLYVYENRLCSNAPWDINLLHSGVRDTHYKLLSEDIDNDGDLDVLSLGGEDGVARLFLNNEPNLPITTYRLNFGRASFIDPDNNHWQLATDIRARGGDGSSYENNIPIANTENDVLYQSEIYGSKLRYDIPVGPTGPFTVKLHFAEIFHGIKNTNGVGARIFNVDIENGQGQLLNYDIIEKAGAPAIAIVEVFNNIEVIDGFISIDLTVVKEKAKISGIEIISEGTINNLAPVIYSPGSLLYSTGDTVNYAIVADDLYGDALTFSQTGLPDFLDIDPKTGIINGILAANPGEYPVTITATDPGGLYNSKDFTFFAIDSPTVSLYNLNAGGFSLTYKGKDWQPDQYFDGGGRYSDNIQINGENDYNIYHGERYGNAFTYNIPVNDSGLYIVRLHFAEIYHGVKNIKGIGTRVFNVNVENGQGELQHYDIIEKAGATRRSIIETFNNIQVNDGALTIAFTTIKNNAKISGIEVIKYGEDSLSVVNTTSNTTTKFSENYISVYPNPIHDRFKIDLTVTEQEGIFVYLANGYGKRLELGSYVIPEGSNTLDFDINALNLPPGLYYLVIESDRKINRGSKLFIK